MEMNSFLDNKSFGVDKLSQEIFSLLETKFLFPSDFLAPNSDGRDKNMFKADVGNVRILSIDGAGSIDGILATKLLVHLESCLCQKLGNLDARIADFFDVGTGCGVGGVLAALLFTKGKEGRPLFKASEALQFIRRKLVPPSSKGLLGRLLRSYSKADKILHHIFGESTLKDTLKPVLIPCYDLSTRAPFLFSRTDAVENDTYDFKMSEVCTATLADPMKGAFGMSSTDKRTRILAVDGGVAMNNPTSAAITHVLNNKQEFPFCNGVEDLLVVSLGNGVSNSASVPDFIKIGRDAASDMVDESVSMAFGEVMESNYLRIQANGINNIITSKSSSSPFEMADKMLEQRNVESVLFRGKKVVEFTNSYKLERFAGELIKEKERRKSSILPTVMFKNSSPRSSSATVSTVSSYVAATRALHVCISHSQCTFIQVNVRLTNWLLTEE